MNKYIYKINKVDLALKNKDFISIYKIIKEYKYKYKVSGEGDYDFEFFIYKEDINSKTGTVFTKEGLKKNFEFLKESLIKNYKDNISFINETIEKINLLDN